MDLSSTGNSQSWFLRQITLQYCKKLHNLIMHTDLKNNKITKNKQETLQSSWLNLSAKKPCLELALLHLFIISLILMFLSVKKNWIFANFCSSSQEKISGSITGLFPFLLLVRDIMTKATYKRQHLIWGLMVPEGFIPWNHGGQHGNRQTGMVLEP